MTYQEYTKVQLADAGLEANIHNVSAFHAGHRHAINGGDPAKFAGADNPALLTGLAVGAKERAALKELY